MTPIDIRASVLTLHQQSTGLREISRVLHLSRNTVRGILREPQGVQTPAHLVNEVTQQQLTEVYARAKGNAVRMAQILADEYKLHPPYSTLTRWVRQAELRQPPKRSGEYHFEPGQEMQHDTSPHKMEVAGKSITAQCAGLTLAYSRRLFIWYYPRFTRFEAKDFLLRAAQFMDGTCPLCVIDNTSVILAGGAGPDAVFAPEMAAFARALGFKFMAHRVNDPGSQSQNRAPLAWVEDNFLPGRSFSSFDDLNAQALKWCVEVANAKPKRSLGMAPEVAYVMEKPYLTSLSIVLPAVYEVFERVVDLYGLSASTRNRVSTPERLVSGDGDGCTSITPVSEIHYKRTPGGQSSPFAGVRDACSTLPGHHTIPNARLASLR
ncbi:MAG: transposase [Rhodoferax sp.]|nr:transposase [Rhodoferax sp.]